MIVNKTTLTVLNEYEFRNLFPNTSFPAVLSNAALEGTNYIIIDEPEQPQLSRYQVAKLGNPYKYSGQIKVKWEITTEVPPIDQLLREYELAIDNLIDQKAKEYKYNSVYTMISYRGDPNPKFAREAESMFLWRSQVWTKANEVLEFWQQELENSNETLPPSVEDVLAELPEFTLIS